MKYLIFCITCTCLLFCSAVNVFAHKVIVFAWVEDGMIHTESSFGSKRKAQNCSITLKNEGGQVLKQGTTDSQGAYALEIPVNPSSDLIVFLDAGSGHQASWRIAKAELIPGTANKTNEDIKRKGKVGRRPVWF